jgi:hypothetical protein
VSARRRPPRRRRAAAHIAARAPLRTHSPTHHSPLTTHHSPLTTPHHATPSRHLCSAASVPAQAAFEKAVFAKVARAPARGDPEVALLDDAVVVYRSLADLVFVAAGAAEESELLLAAALGAFADGVALLLRGAAEKKAALENLDLVLLALDEVVDGGLILETDAATVAARVAMRSADDDGAGPPLGGGLDGPGLQSLNAAFGNIKEQIARSLLK